MDRRAYLGAAGSAFVAAVSGCTDVAGDIVGGLSEDDYDIGMAANAFRPEAYEASVGDTVVWGNNGSRGHTVTAYESTLQEGAAFFASGDAATTTAAREAWQETGAGDIAPGETFAHTFETPGDHGYFCVPHEAAGMVGTIVVTDD